MTQKRFTSKVVDWWNNVNEVRVIFDKGEWIDADDCAKLLNALYEENEQLKSENEDMRRLINNISYQRDEFHRGARENANRVGKLKKENEQLKKELKRCKDWINSDKNDYELTLAFIKNKGYSLKDVLEYEKELEIK